VPACDPPADAVAAAEGACASTEFTAPVPNKAQIKTAAKTGVFENQAEAGPIAHAFTELS
jgi:hypothetical protein